MANRMATFRSVVVRCVPSPVPAAVFCTVGDGRPGLGATRGVDLALAVAGSHQWQWRQGAAGTCHLPKPRPDPSPPPPGGQAPPAGETARYERRPPHRGVESTVAAACPGRLPAPGRAAAHSVAAGSESAPTVT